MASSARANVLVVGGSSGIGLATAKLALTNLPRANIVLVSTNEEKLQKAVAELKATSPNEDALIDHVVGDVSRIASQFNDMEAILKAAVARFQSTIDHIIWTAGAYPHAPKSDHLTNDDILEVAGARLFGPLTLVNLGKKYMTDSRKSSVTLSSGIAIYKPRPGSGRLIGIMSGFESAVRALAVDLAPIRANFVVLGPFRTAMLDRFAPDEAAIKAYADATLFKSVGEVDEAAEAYLASMRCSFMTGSRIDSDGGALLC
ncbi:uncharacterized protein LTR77_003625 [Saxophila tyrrhenica]|uniref:Uncharacterized protein n=1 Tax=Saxophila tyrrhenica TaxID=1690608 RepID=A0AAV9PGS7_9PEZI|nr:hypothetical protein LTR77_003625 [Saxophila tyrrhenica]